MDEITWEDVRKLIIGIRMYEGKDITFDTEIMDDLEFDSLDVMQLLSQIEEQFGVDFTDLDNFEERFNRCGDLYEGILELVSSAQGSNMEI